MIHLDLFSGIGGFAYAADQVWDNVEHIFCDNDKFCQQVLKKHWPESKIYDDIRDITDPEYKRWRRLDNKQRNRNKSKTRGSNQWCDLLTGGFPCQPFSAAGIRRGTSDERYLWPEMLRVIRLTKPTWVIAENVRGLLTWEQGMVVEQVCADLEASGYSAQPFIIPAVAVNAPHRRDRIWFVAHRKSQRNGGSASQGRLSGEWTLDSKEQGWGEVGSKSQRRTSQPSDDADSSIKGLQGSIWQGKQGNSGRFTTQNSGERKSWNQNWLTVATELCGVDDGLPAGLDGFELSRSSHRKERLKSLGNAIVPQVAIEIMKGMSI